MDSAADIRWLAHSKLSVVDATPEGSGFLREKSGGCGVFAKATLRWRPAYGASDPARPVAKGERMDVGYVLSQPMLAVSAR